MFGVAILFYRHFNIDPIFGAGGNRASSILYQVGPFLDRNWDNDDKVVGRGPIAPAARLEGDGKMDAISDQCQLPRPEFAAAWDAIKIGDDVRTRLVAQALLALRLRQEYTFEVMPEQDLPARRNRGAAAPPPDAD